jgi:AraC-like DNA-binding protein
MDVTGEFYVTFIMTAFLQTIVLLGAIQGIIVGFLLFYTAKNRHANRYLAVLIWLMAMASLSLYFYQKGWFYINTVTAFFHALVPTVVVMPFGPLMYFYVQALLNPAFSLQQKQRNHFWPVIIDLVPQLTALIFILGVMMGLVIPNAGPWGIFIDEYNKYADIPRWLSLTMYVWLCARYLKLEKQKNNQAHASQFQWLQQFVRIFLAFQAIWFIYLIPYVIPRYSNWLLNTFDWYPVYIPMAVLIYWLGIKGYFVSYVYATAAKKVTASSLDAGTVEQAVAVLKQAMETDHLYLDPALNLNTVAMHTGLVPKTISAVLNQYLQKSFNEFVNEYRVAAFKQKILQEDVAHLTMNGIAAECGFNSQTTFQRTFKQITGMSPSAFRKMATENQS